MLPFIKRLLLIFFTISFSLKTTSQNTLQVDSLEKKSFKELSELFYDSKPDTLKATIYAKAKFRKALKEKDTLEMLNGKYLLADILNNRNIYLDFCDSLINISKKTPTENFPAAIYIDKATFFFHKRQNNKALKELIKANKIIEKKENLYLKNKTLYLIATIQSSIGQNEKALKLYKEVYNYASKENLITKDVFFSTLPLNLTIEYRNLNKIDSAYLFNSKAVKIYKKINDSVNLGYSYYSLGLVYQKKKEYSKALKSYLKSIPTIEDDENYRILVSSYIKIAKLYDTLGFDNKSLKYHLKADSIFKAKKIPSKFLEDTYKYLLDYYKTKDLKKQLIYVNKLLEIKEFKLFSM